MFKKMIVVAAVAAGSLALTACAHAAGGEYELKRIPMGPRPDYYVMVRAGRHKPLGAPDSVAGPQRQKTELRLVQRWAGPHYIGPVWVRDERQDD